MTRVIDFTAQVNGAQTVFATSESFTVGSLNVFLNGVLQAAGDFFNETATGFTTLRVALVGDTLKAMYETLEATAGNLPPLGG